MKDVALRNILEKGGVIFLKGDEYIRDGCYDFNYLWKTVHRNKIALEALIDYLGLELTNSHRIQKTHDHDHDFGKHNEEYARLIHYPEQWDTAAYPTLDSALREALASAGCPSYRQHGI